MVPRITSHIGAGGGSIAYVDEGGAFRVGPRSAGAAPGPACYGRGGTEPTVTDAHAVLGRLDPDNFLGGNMQLYPEKAAEAVGDLAARLGMSEQEAAAGIITILNKHGECHPLVTTQKATTPGSSAWSPSEEPGRCTRRDRADTRGQGGDHPRLSGINSAIGCSPPT